MIQKSSGGWKYTSTFSKEKFGLILLAAMNQAVMFRESVRAPIRLDTTHLLSAKLDSRLHQIVVTSDAVAVVWDFMALSD